MTEYKTKIWYQQLNEFELKVLNKNKKIKNETNLWVK